jgi:hypothetical protein
MNASRRIDESGAAWRFSSEHERDKGKSRPHVCATKAKQRNQRGGDDREDGRLKDMRVLAVTDHHRIDIGHRLPVNLRESI